MPERNHWNMAIAIAFTACLLGFIGLLVGCDTNVDKAPPTPESTGNRFIVEARASVDTNSIYVLRDKVTGKLIYLTPGSGVYVEEAE